MTSSRDEFGRWIPTPGRYLYLRADQSLIGKAIYVSPKGWELESGEPITPEEYYNLGYRLQRERHGEQPRVSTRVAFGGFAVRPRYELEEVRLAPFIFERYWKLPNGSSLLLKEGEYSIPVNFLGIPFNNTWNVRLTTNTLRGFRAYNIPFEESDVRIGDREQEESERRRMLGIPRALDDVRESVSTITRASPYVILGAIALMFYLVYRGART
jgi:hypothetical protein